MSKVDYQNKVLPIIKAWKSFIGYW